MKDLRSEFYKIGFSNNPVYREKTLQAEQPLILLVDSWEGTKTDEKTLHKTFDKVRVRGEWFRLVKEHLSQIYRYFYDRSNLRAVEELKEAKAKIYNLERDVCLWKSRFEFLDQQVKKEKAKLIPPKLELPEPPPAVITSRRDVLVSTQLSRLPSLPKRNSFVPSNNQTVERLPPHLSFLQDKHSSTGVTLRFRDDSNAPQFYTDEVPF